MVDAAAHRAAVAAPDDHRAGEHPPRAVAHLGSVLHDPVHGERDEIVELDLGGGDQPGDRSSDHPLHEEILRDRAVDDAHRAEALVEAPRRLEYAAVTA